MRRFTRLALAAFLLTGALVASAPDALAVQNKDDKTTPTAEQVAETVVLVFGQRPVLAQVRRSGIERGRLTRSLEEGRSEEITYERSFKRGESVEKDKVRLSQKRLNQEYALVYNEGRVWGVVKGTTFTPRQEDVDDLLSDTHHSLDALLRYKENGATVAFIGKDRQKNIEMWILDLTDKDKKKTRYYISASTGRVLWLEYEDAPAGAASPVKYKRTFHDYRIIQGTRVPFRSVLYAGDRQVEEELVLNVVYGVKMDDDIFKNPEAASAQP
ncbi:MAG TPA: hypothetical protein VM934_04375 [Pyrinomonadaceae bacterium]|nr:hypothetical protein [Pyrinomonadaceae bacterium]